MSLINPDENQPTEPPRGHVRMVYLGPVGPTGRSSRSSAIVRSSRSSVSVRWRASFCSRPTIPSSGGIASASCGTQSARTSFSNGTSACRRKRWRSPEGAGGRARLRCGGRAR